VESLPVLAVTDFNKTPTVESHDFGGSYDCFHCRS
jgi:hypothetical protein